MIFNLDTADAEKNAAMAGAVSGLSAKPGNAVFDTSAPAELENALACMLAEAEVVDELLTTLAGPELLVPTPFANWDVADVIRHLIEGDSNALLAIVQPSAFETARSRLVEATSPKSPGAMEDQSSFARLRSYERLKYNEVGEDRLISIWREGVEKLADAVRSVTEDRPVEWFGPPMKISRLMAARQMELWCYGLDVFDAFKIKRVNRDAIRPVAEFGIKTRSYAFRTAGIDVPVAPYVRLTAPSGRIWTWGDEHSPERVEGPAEEFCAVVTQRRNRADTTITTKGPGAEQWMAVAQTITGGPYKPPEPGQRAWEVTMQSCAPRLPHRARAAEMIRHFSSKFGSLPQIVEDESMASFSQIATRSGVVAKGLLARGLVTGNRIGVLIPNGADWVVALFAILRVGGVAIPLSTFARGQELERLLADADLNFLIRQSDLKPLENDGTSFPDTALRTAEDAVDEDAPALVIFTSGTSAAAKGVIHSQANLVRQAHRMSAYMTFERGDRLLTTMPFFWVGGLITSLLATSYAGASVICPTNPQPKHLIEAARRHQATHIALWATQLRQILEQPGATDIIQQLRPTSAQQLGLFGFASAKQTPNSLGLTETLGPHSMEYAGRPLPIAREGSFGRQVGEIERGIFDPVSRTELPPGVIGEIALRGGHLMLGMQGRSHNEVFTADGWYFTGDLGSIDEAGYLYFTGRKNDLIKCSGANIAPQEIEAAVMALSQVQEAIAVGLPDPARDEILAVAIVLNPGAELTEAMIKAELALNLSSYKVPRLICFLTTDEVPRTPSAKVRRNALRALMLDRAQI